MALSLSKVFVMKILFFLILVSFMSSCKKTAIERPLEPEPPVIPKDTLIKPDYSIKRSTFSKTELTVDLENVSIFYPGSILTIDSSNGRLKFDQVKGYTVLPVFYYSNNTILPIKEIVPSFETLKDYLYTWNISEEKGSSTIVTAHSWTDFIDNRFLFNFGMGSMPYKSFVELFPKYDVEGISPKNINRLLSVGNVQLLDVSMDHVFGEGELLSVEDYISLTSSVKENYLVVSVQYGFEYMIVAESERVSSELKPSLNRVFMGNTLSSDDINILDTLDVFLYLRSSVFTQPIIKKARGSVQIKSLFEEFDSVISTMNYSIPISFTLFNLKDFSTFRYNYSNQWSSRIE